MCNKIRRQDTYCNFYGCVRFLAIEPQSLDEQVHNPGSCRENNVIENLKLRVEGYLHAEALGTQVVLRTRHLHKVRWISATAPANPFCGDAVLWKGVT
jgi:hypothetical protein